MTFPASPTIGEPHTDRNGVKWSNSNGIWIKNSSAAAVTYYSQIPLLATDPLPTTFTTPFIVNDLVNPAQAYVWVAANSQYETFDTGTAATPPLPAVPAGNDTSATFGGESVFFTADGMRMMLPQSGAADDVFFYDLTTAYDISTRGAQMTTNVSGGVSAIGTRALSPDGTKAIMLRQLQNEAREFTLATPFDFGTASSTNTHNLSSWPHSSRKPIRAQWSPDGSKAFISSHDTGATNLDRISMLNCPTPYSFAGATYANTVTVAWTVALGGFFITPDGLTLYTALDAGIEQWSFGTAFDLTTLTLVGDASASWGGVPPSRGGFLWEEYLTGGTVRYIVGSDYVRQIV